MATGEYFLFDLVFTGKKIKSIYFYLKIKIKISLNQLVSIRLIETKKQKKIDFILAKHIDQVFLKLQIKKS